MSKVYVPGILIFHQKPLVPNASTIDESLQAFGRHSRFDVFSADLNLQFPTPLVDFEFAVVVFHYSLSCTCDWLSAELKQYLAACPRSYKVAFFQDEYRCFQERFDFLNQCRIDCLYSRHKPQHVAEIYGPHTTVSRFRYYLAGYVSEEAIEAANRLFRPWQERGIDVGYRGREMQYYLGRAGQEKHQIGVGFRERAKDAGLRLDIAVEEEKRVYQENWHEFLADCRAVLGVEGGASVIDFDGFLRKEYHRLCAERPGLTFEEYAQAMGPRLSDLEGRYYYRSISPRHFEAAAFRTLQILFEGRYDDVLQPLRHYIPLKKDFSNMEEVLALVSDQPRVAEMVERAHEDLIASGNYSYKKFIESLDAELAHAGVLQEKVHQQLKARLAGFLDEWSSFSRRTCVNQMALTSLVGRDVALDIHVRRCRQRLEEQVQKMCRRRPEVRDRKSVHNERRFWKGFDAFARLDYIKRGGRPPLSLELMMVRGRRLAKRLWGCFRQPRG